ncbi:hypothetical protein ACHAWF_005303 [Thalassiosira exigua]
MTMKRRLSCLVALAAGCHAALAFTAPRRRIPPGISRPSSAAPAPRPVAAADVDDRDAVDGGDGDSDDDAELALLLPGQTLRIRIGDVSSSRKAWKKRRRNSSPVLVPCSVLGMSREWMVRWNVLTLLHAIGEEHPAAGGAVSATAGKIGRAYRRRLGGDLRSHAAALGRDSPEALLRSLFDEKIRAEYGVRTFEEPRHGNLVLSTDLTRRQARQFSSSAGLVQFRPETAEDGHLLEGNEKMIHTGAACVPLPNSLGDAPRYAQESLGAALRVSPYDEVAERYREGDEFNAYVHSFDARGDNESPLLVLTADDPRGKVGTGTSGTSTRVFKRRNARGGGGGALAEDASIERELTDLRAGDGPFDATVAAVSKHSGAAFVDCGVGRRRGKRYGGGLAKVLGMLRFEDIEGGDSDVKAGDEIQVFVKAVSPQSGRFMVTVDASVKDKKAGDIKREKRADKRKERLEKRISQEDIDDLIGTIYEGIVKAKSKAGDWYYVQPESGEVGEGGDYDVGGAASLPVGVASYPDNSEGGGDGSSRGPYEAGDRVRVRLEGIDKERGQLALSLLD